MQLPLVAMVLREASALMRISSNYYYPAHAQKRDTHYNTHRESLVSLAQGARQLYIYIYII